jgi:type IV secretory pathway VirB10-like protein
MPEIYHNVSVRLSETDYKKLKYIHEKHNRMSYGKVGLADVLRTALSELFITEYTDANRKVTDVNESRFLADKIINGEVEEVPKEVVEKVIPVETAKEVTPTVTEETNLNQSTIDEFIEDSKEEVKEEETTEETVEETVEPKTEVKMSLTEEEQKQLDSYEKLLRSQKNSKGKAYSDKWIKQRLNGKLNDIISKREE